ncbi:hypothetical protein ANANG_G00132830 [Anguilla anguilla]|uniref:Uncharacterized protein n=1 Tax=Anguilla anguilla TaxID=7936 RepID=A0A9D3M9E8_ANGAN|nr:hypothetical protein ANANG_G00132830 [Anguilla anguilla]
MDPPTATTSALQTHRNELTHRPLAGCCSLSQSALGKRQEYTLDRLPLYHKRCHIVQSALLTSGKYQESQATPSSPCARPLTAPMRQAQFSMCQAIDCAHAPGPVLHAPRPVLHAPGH